MQLIKTYQKVGEGAEVLVDERIDRSGYVGRVKFGLGLQVLNSCTVDVEL